MPDLQLQPSIATDLRSQVHLKLINRLGGLDLTPMLVYRIPSLVDSAVLAMAWQWDVLNPLLLPNASQLVTLGYPGWDAIANIDQLTNIDLLQYQADEEESLPLTVLYAKYRALILLSTKLHSTMGTVAALKNGLASLGFPNAVVQEGQNSWGGTQYPSDEGWAAFRVTINLATIPPDTDLADLQVRMVGICNYWKPARCVLDSVVFNWPLSDALPRQTTDRITTAFIGPSAVITLSDALTDTSSIVDSLSAPFAPIADTKTITPLHDTRYYHAGVTYGSTKPRVADSGTVISGVPVSDE